MIASSKTPLVAKDLSVAYSVHRSIYNSHHSCDPHAFCHSSELVLLQLYLRTLRVSELCPNLHEFPLRQGT